MRAWALDFEERRLRLVDARLLGGVDAHGPERAGVVIRIHAVGVCGTDRELAEFRFGEPPQGERCLILGHEAIGQVVSAPVASAFRPGDWVAPQVRQACRPACRVCARGEPDLCLTGQYRERGIFRAHGFLQPSIEMAAEELARVPDALGELGVLIEPASVVEKAIRVGTELRREPVESAAVIGAGPIGLLAALLLRQRGVAVTVHSRETGDHPRARLIRNWGIPYNEPGRVDLAIEAAGSSAAVAKAVSLLGPLGVAVTLGGRNEAAALPLLDMIVGNQKLAGVVNASPADFRHAAERLARLDRAVLAALIARRPFQALPDSLSHPGEAVKTIHVLD